MTNYYVEHKGMVKNDNQIDIMCEILTAAGLLFFLRLKYSGMLCRLVA